MHIQQIMDFEDGSLSEAQTIDLFQNLVDSGLAWQLQGVYGRTATAMIEAGLVSTERCPHCNVRWFNNPNADPALANMNICWKCAKPV